MHINDAMLRGEICGDRGFSKKAEAILDRLHPGAKCKLTTSCTSALEAAALALGIDEDAEVIVPSYTFVSTASAFAMRGARIRFIDSRPDTLNLDERLLEGMIEREPLCPFTTQACRAKWTPSCPSPIITAYR